MLINLSKYIHDNGKLHSIIAEDLNNKLKEAMEVLDSGDRVIIVLSEGIRVEIETIYEVGKEDFYSFLKDFKSRFEYNQMMNEVEEIKKNLYKSLEDNKEATKDLDEFFNLNEELEKKLLFRLDIYKIQSRKDVLVKTIGPAHKEHIEGYLYGLLESMGLKLNHNFSA